MIVSLTNKLVDQLKPNLTKDEFYWDKDLTGFGLKITPYGKKVYILQRTFKNDQNQKVESHRITLGAHGQIDCAMARGFAVQKTHTYVKNIVIDRNRNLPRPFETPKVVAPVSDIPLFSKVCDMFMMSKKSDVTDNTFNTYTHRLQRYLVPYFKSKRIDEITRKDVLELKTSLSEHPIQANQTMGLLKGVFNFAIQLEYIHKNPCLDIAYNKKNLKDSFLSQEEIQRIWVYLAARKTQKDRILQVMILTGLRISEVLQARWENINFKENIWTCPSVTSKTNQTLIVPVTGKTLEVFLDQRSFFDGVLNPIYANQCPFVFAVDDHSGSTKATKILFTTGDISSYFKKVLKAVGINDRYTPHDIRHAYASLLVKKGVPLLTIQETLGHTNYRSTLVYAHLEKDKAYKTREEFQGMLFQD